MSLARRGIISTGDIAISIAWLHFNSKGQITVNCLLSSRIDTVSELRFPLPPCSARYLQGILMEMSTVHNAQMLPVIAKRQMVTLEYPDK